MLMERLQEDWNYEYRVTPLEYPISDNIRPATYDQFMSLRDTMVYSNKFYGNNAWRSLIVGIKTDWNPTNTIEIWEPNIMRQWFEPDWTTNDETVWKFVSSGDHTSTNPLSCEINLKGRYRLQHKQQFTNISSSITRIHSYIVQHHGNQIIERAVFDWERNTPWEIVRLTSFGYVECDLDKSDWLELKIEDQNGNDITSEAEQNSNWWMVEYIDLAYNI